MANQEKFEDLVQIWDFTCNFHEWLEIKPFKLEELYAALHYQGPEECDLLSDLFESFVYSFVDNISDEVDEESDQKLWMLQEYCEGKVKFIWPELVRFILSSQEFDFVTEGNEYTVQKL